MPVAIFFCLGTRKRKHSTTIIFARGDQGLRFKRTYAVDYFGVARFDQRTVKLVEPSPDIPIVNWTQSSTRTPVIAPRIAFSRSIGSTICQFLQNSNRAGLDYLDAISVVIRSKRDSFGSQTTVWISSSGYCAMQA